MVSMLAATVDLRHRVRRLKIDLVVHGRFHAFDLARALINLGHDVLVYTNYTQNLWRSGLACLLTA